MGELKLSEKRVEAVFLAVVFVLFFWLSVGPTLDHRIKHPYPFGYQAQDPNI